MESDSVCVCVCAPLSACGYQVCLMPPHIHTLAVVGSQLRPTKQASGTTAVSRSDGLNMLLIFLDNTAVSHILYPTACVCLSLLYCCCILVRISGSLWSPHKERVYFTELAPEATVTHLRPPLDSWSWGSVVVEISIHTLCWSSVLSGCTYLTVLYIHNAVFVRNLPA